jgi:hypothetical protein
MIKDFMSRVRDLADPEDFEHNSHLLDQVPEHLEDYFVDGLVCGYKIRKLFIALNDIDVLSRHLPEKTDLMMLIKPFVELHYKLETDPAAKVILESDEDPVGVVMNLIDGMKSYASLNFLREHMEFRIATYIQNLIKTVPSALKNPWKKVCPTCGMQNEMVDVKCTRCGFEAK